MLQPWPPPPPPPGWQMPGMAGMVTKHVGGQKLITQLVSLQPAASAATGSSACAGAAVSACAWPSEKPALCIAATGSARTAAPMPSGSSSHRAMSAANRARGGYSSIGDGGGVGDGVGGACCDCPLPHE